jgi:hypothetical protein
VAITKWEYLELSGSYTLLHTEEGTVYTKIYGYKYGLFDPEELRLEESRTSECRSKALARLGKEGWELIFIHEGNYHFKRPKE